MTTPVINYCHELLHHFWSSWDLKNSVQKGVISKLIDDFVQPGSRHDSNIFFNMFEHFSRFLNVFNSVWKCSKMFNNCNLCTNPANWNLLELFLNIFEHFWTFLISKKCWKLFNLVWQQYCSFPGCVERGYWVLSSKLRSKLWQFVHFGSFPIKNSFRNLLCFEDWIRFFQQL
jgi:hypothetical protein